MPAKPDGEAKTDVDVLVTITPDDGNSAWLKVVWSQGISGFRPYLVDADALRETAKEVRRSLGDVVTKAMQSGIDTCGPELHAVAKAGYTLRLALFDKRGGEEDPEVIEQWLASRDPGTMIVFRVEPRIHIPWGLIYDTEIDEPVGGACATNMNRYSDFWALKYRLSTMYLRIPPDSDDRQISGGSLSIITVINKTAYEQAVAPLSPDEQAWVHSIVAAGGEPAYAPTDLFERWKKSVGKNCVIYFYCHGDGSSLAFAEESLTPTNLRLKLKRNAVDGASTSLVILNGCSTAAGDPSGGFLEATGPPSFCGFIGTEAAVPDIFALRFGAEMLRTFLQSGHPIRDVVHELRERHWPLSLLYSVCCYPEITVIPPSALKGISAFDTHNFSTQKIGSANDRTMA